VAANQADFAFANSQQAQKSRAGAPMQEQSKKRPIVAVREIISLPNVKEHATLSAGASVDHRVEVKTTKDHENRAADRGCVSRLVRFLF
jgi:hypothetical protein